MNNMRELKFRVWDNLKKDWLKKRVYHASLATNDGGIGEFCFKQHPDGFTIQQYTGLKDKDGKEIFEGDILEWGMSYNTSEPSPRLRFVEFYEPQLIYKAVEVGPLPAGVTYLYEARSNSTRWCRVVGNILENTELLND